MYYVINPLNGYLYGPFEKIEQAQHCINMTTFPSEWIIVKKVTNYYE